MSGAGGFFWGLIAVRILLISWKLPDDEEVAEEEDKV